jgi:hypothetical protein
MASLRGPSTRAADQPRDSCRLTRRRVRYPSGSSP